MGGWRVALPSSGGSRYRMKGADLSWGLDCPHRLPVESNTRKSGAGYFQLASGEGGREG